MPSPRNSRFLENFDDGSSDSSSPESTSTTSSPEHTPGSIPSQLMQKFSSLMLRHTSPRGANQGKEMASQVQSPVQMQATAQVQASATDQNKEVQDSEAQDKEAHGKEAHTADMPSEQLAVMLDDYSIPTLALNTDTTSESPSNDETTATEAQIHDMQLSSSDLKTSPEGTETEINVDSQPEHKPDAIKKNPRSSPFVKQDPKQSKTYMLPPRPRHKSRNMGDVMERMFDEIMADNNTPADIISNNSNRLLQDIQRFEQQRDETAVKFQKCYASHTRAKMSPLNCIDCFLYVEKIEHGYIDTCLKMRKMMEELCDHIKVSFLESGVCEQAEDDPNITVVKEMSMHVISVHRLKELERMLQWLEDDAEAAKGWPQVPLSDAPPEDDETKSSQTKSRKGGSKQQKKKKKGRR